MQRKKLLMTASTFPRWKGDTEPRFILDLAKALNQYYDVTVLVPAAIGALDGEVMEGVKVVRYHYLPIHKWETLCYPGAIVPRIREKRARALQVPFLLLALWITLLRLKSKYDLIHAHWLIPQGIVQGLVGGKYIVTGHGDDVTSFNRGIIKRLKGRCLNRAQHITIVSKPLKSILTGTYSLPEDKVDIISMGCDYSRFSPEHRDESMFGDKGRKSIVFVGRLVERKGVTYLIDAMEHIDADLYIVGVGPEEQNLKEQAKQFPGKIHFMGAKSHHDLPSIYASADVCVFPSIRASDGTVEGFGLTILEAMASGTSVVASKSGGIADIIEDGVNGLFVEEGNSDDISNKVNRLLNNEELAAGIREGALRTAKKYDYYQIAQKYAQIIENIQCISSYV